MNRSMMSCFVSSCQLGPPSCAAMVHNILRISTSPSRVVPSWRISAACTTGHGRFILSLPTVAPARAGGGMNPLTTMRISLLLV